MKHIVYKTLLLGILTLYISGLCNFTVASVITTGTFTSANGTGVSGLGTSTLTWGTGDKLAFSFGHQFVPNLPPKPLLFDAGFVEFTNGTGTGALQSATLTLSFRDELSGKLLDSTDISLTVTTRVDLSGPNCSSAAGPGNALCGLDPQNRNDDDSLDWAFALGSKGMRVPEQSSQTVKVLAIYDDLLIYDMAFFSGKGFVSDGTNASLAATPFPTELTPELLAKLFPPATPVPLPPSIGLLISALAGLSTLGWRRKYRAS